MPRTFPSLAALALLVLPLALPGCDNVDEFSNPVFLVSIKGSYRTDPAQGRPRKFQVSRRPVAGGVRFQPSTKTGGFTATDFDGPEFNGTFDDAAADSVSISAQDVDSQGLAFWVEIQLERMANRGVAANRDRGARPRLDFHISSATLAGQVTCEPDDQQSLEVEASVEFTGTVAPEGEKVQPTPISGKLRLKGAGDANYTPNFNKR